VAARTAAEQLSLTTTTMKIHLLESSSTLGGRVQSDRTEEGFCLDRGFAVFIPNYPMVQQCLDLEALQLRSFIPGSRVWVRGEKENQDGKWIKVSDPLRQPLELWNALMAPVGSSIVDKIKLLPLLWHVFSKSVPELFEEDETTTLEALRDRWGFSNEMIDAFFKPFLEGIYLAPLTDQSSRMFSFVFKMFSEGSATLPRGGIGAVAKQLADKARDAGVTIDTDTCVTMIHPPSKEDGSFLIETKKMTNNQEKSSDSKYYRAKSVIVATDVRVAESLLSNQKCSEVTTELWSEIPQRSVGCLYYSFDGEPPISEPILFLKGLSSPTDTPETHPINNVCFPSIVNPSYAPTGKSLCSVTILSNVLDHFDGDIPNLEVAVRHQLQGWFPSITSWSFLRHYVVRNAQPSQVGMYGANVNGGRDCRQFRGISLPPGLMVCGDHMATATLNGALESGVKAGTLAAAQEIARDT
jgi:phytoene dehydrogenase-like protein